MWKITRMRWFLQVSERILPFGNKLLGNGGEMFLIKNCYMIDPRSGEEGIRDILLEGECIRAISPSGLSPAPDMEVYDATGLVAAPGLVDVHVHFRDPGFLYKEDILTGSKAAVQGGFTTVILMANTKPVVDNRETLSYVLEKGRETGIHVESCCAITRGLQGKELTQMSELKAAGAVGFTDDGIPLLDEMLVRRAMEEAKRIGTVLSFHEEDPACIVNNGIHGGGKAAAYYGIGGSDRSAEIGMIRRDIRLAEQTGAVINIQHISTREGVELVRHAKAKGANVHAEATPHHFTLTEEAAIRYGTLAKMNPPLREEADRLAIIRGLQDGTIDLIATDHAPHSPEEKERGITEAPSGIIGLETALPLGITSLVEPGYLTMAQLLEKLTWNPAALYGLDRGYLAAGGPADLVLFAPKQRYVPERFASKSRNSPFLGMELLGRVKAAICSGQVLYRAEE